MIGQIDKSPQLEIFKVPLKHIVRGEHGIVNLTHEINWDKIVTGLSIHYSPDKGRKAIPVRKIAGLVILKDIFQMTDEAVTNRWIKDPYFQYFCGEIYQQHKLPFNRSELVKFRQRIGMEGLGVIFSPEVLILIDEFRNGQLEVSTTEHPDPYFLRIFKKLIYG